MRRTRLLILLSLLALPLSAQTPMPQNFERGFAPEKAYNFGNLDSVGLFNGNLVLTIPIGGSYPIGGGSSYSLTLAYNANLWNYVEVPVMEGSTMVFKPWAAPNPQSNAGVGWSLSLGRITKPNDADNRLDDSAYISPDGNEHIIGLTGSPYPQYTTDGTYYRWNVNVDHLESPDGSTRTFYDDETLRGKNGYGWLKEMDDAYGNWVKVTQTFSTVDQFDPSGSSMLIKWTVTDSAGRTHYVNFKRFYGSTALTTPKYPTTLTNYKTVIDSVDLQTAGGRAVYNFTYADEAGNVDFPTTVFAGCKTNASGYANSFNLPFLRKVTLPDGSTYEASYRTPGGFSCGDGENGVIEKLKLPTKGAIAWKFGSYAFPKFSCSDNGFWSTTAGVRERELFDRAGNSLGKTTYSPEMADPVYIPCEGSTNGWTRPIHQQVINTVVYPSGRKDVNHFTSTLEEAGTDTPSDLEYGLPLYRGPHGSNPAVSQMDAQGRGISVETYPCPTCTPRKKWLLYDLGDNASVRSEHMQFEDGKSTYTDRSERDSYGHYKTTTISSSVAGETSRTTKTNYTPDVTRWILNKYDYQTVTDGTGGPVAKTETCFDDRGFLTRSRTLRDGASNAQGGRSASDLLSVFTDDGHGNVVKEQYFGGDGGSLGSGSQDTLCTLSLPSVSYEITHGYSHGVQSDTKYMNGTTVVLQPVTRTIDTSGAVLSETDPSGLSTSYAYKTWGAYDNIQGPGQSFTSATKFQYDVAGSTSQAKTTITQNDQGVTYVFDDLGRPIVEKRRLPDVNSVPQYSVRRTTYDIAGRKETVSEFENLPSGTDETTFVPAHHTTYAYDGFDRPIVITAPDGSSTLFTYTDSVTTKRTVSVATTDTGSANVDTIEKYDTRGRLKSVTENSGTSGGSVVTSYDYDLGDHLSHVTMNGGGEGTQERFFHYDYRGLLTSEQHPEIGPDPAGNGTISYTYDARGHTKTKVTGSSAALNLAFTYDKAERLTQVDDGNGNRLKKFDFGTANVPSDNYVTGRLQTAIRDNRLDSSGHIRVTETYAYGSDANAKERKTAVASVNDSTGTESAIQEFTQQFVYDTSGNLTSIGYPSTSVSVLGTPAITSMTNRFASGFLVAVPGYSGSGTDAGFTYHPGGMLKEVKHNGSGVTETVDTYDIDSTNGMSRPSRITFSGYTAGTCTPPAAPDFTIQNVICPAVTRTASTTTQASTYKWTIENGTIVGSDSSTTVTYTSANYGVLKLSLTITNACGAAGSASRTAQILSQTTATVSGDALIDAGGSTTIQVAWQVGAPNWTVQWSDGYTQTVMESPATRSVSPTSTTTYTATITDGCSNAAIVNGSATITVRTPVLAVPTGVDAEAQSTTSVQISWNPVQGATYEILRSNHTLPGMNMANYVVIGSSTVPGFLDTSVSSNTSYFYRVRSVNGSGPNASRSDGSAFDVATTVLFSPVDALHPYVLATHFLDELRPAVNAVRALAGQSPYAFSTDLAQHSLIRRVHITELRTALDQARAALGLTTEVYAEDTPHLVVVKFQHVDELRGGVR
jgi:YD repeat-containing protein